MRELVVTPRFERDFRPLPRAVKIEFDLIVQQLRVNPTDRVLGVKKLHNVTPATWRVRSGRYRLLYAYNATSVTLLRVAHRKDIYR